jgi:hypothetical protein
MVLRSDDVGGDWGKDRPQVCRHRRSPSMPCEVEVLRTSLNSIEHFTLYFTYPSLCTQHASAPRGARSGWCPSAA